MRSRTILNLSECGGGEVKLPPLPVRLDDGVRPWWGVPRVPDSLERNAPVFVDTAGSAHPQPHETAVCDIEPTDGSAAPRALVVTVHVAWRDEVSAQAAPDGEASLPLLVGELLSYPPRAVGDLLAHRRVGISSGWR